MWNPYTGKTDRWTARRERAIREGWPSSHGRKPLKTEEQKRQERIIRMRNLRARRSAAKKAAVPLLNGTPEGRD